MKAKIIVVGWSGGVTSAWCGGWALRNYPKDSVVFLWHDTKEEDPDTYRFSKEMARALEHEITERSDGRSVTELMYDNNMLANDRVAFCSRILKQEQRKQYFEQLRFEGINDITLVLGFSRDERRRIQLSAAGAAASKPPYKVRYPVAEEGVSKQACADWCKAQGVCLPQMYTWAEHANCPGCVRGKKNYWLGVLQNRPDVYAQRKAMEEEFGHTFMGEISLERLEKQADLSVIKEKNRIEIGSCECGD